MAGEVVRFKNARVVKGGELIKEHGELWVQDGKIIDPQKYFYEVKKRADKEIDCEGLIIAPGLIDIQFNGAYGIDIASKPDNAVNDVNELSKRLLKNGVTGFCPTIISTKDNCYKQIVSKVKPREGGAIGAEIIGLHLEGPFISKQKKGCHIKSHIKDSVSEEELLDCYGGNLEGVKIITLAPELPGAMETIEWLSKEHKNIIISIGHSCADYKKAETAVEKGATLITHLFNAMLPFHHRDPGIVGLITRHTDTQGSKKDSKDSENPQDSEDQQSSIKPIYYGLIADGHHTLSNAIRIAYRANKHGIVLVSDAAVVAGLKEGKYKIGDLPVEVKDGICVIRGTDTLAGSVAMVDECVRGLMKATGCTVVEAIEAASLHPAKLLGTDNRKGSLDSGKDADFIFLNDKLEVQATYIAGEKVWSLETSP